MDRWFFNVDDEEEGPVDYEELKEMVDDGDIGRNDLVWKEGMTDWRSASTIKGLFSGRPPVRKSRPRAAAPKKVRRTSIVTIMVALFFGMCVFAVFFVAIFGDSKPRRRPNAAMPPPTPIAQPADLSARFDVPLLLTMTFSEIREQLGEPVSEFIPTKQQLAFDPEFTFDARYTNGTTSIDLQYLQDGALLNVFATDETEAISGDSIMRRVNVDTNDPRLITRVQPWANPEKAKKTKASAVAGVHLMLKEPKPASHPKAPPKQEPPVVEESAPTSPPKTEPAAREASKDSKPKTSKRDPDPEKQAAGKLRLAKELLLTSKIKDSASMKRNAEKRLKAIVKDFPDTKAAEEAQELLKKGKK